MERGAADDWGKTGGTVKAFPARTGIEEPVRAEKITIRILRDSSHVRKNVII